MSARDVAAAVTDPELPMLTLEDLGVLRDVTEHDGRVVVTITPTYTGCPAMATMRADLEVALRRAGHLDVVVRTSLSPAWTTDWITERGRRALAEHGIAPPRHDARPAPVDLVLLAPRPALACPLCGSDDTRELSRFGTTACRSLQVCRACGETFDHLKEI
ncbi:MAG: 1,2-phenylacetyl-CoA epoxidase subunit PaaD [Nocardioidaceae bacterium]|nr:1,2-phenylacetyl-CoA epoxidase subunit PaaD [Nocardioidaceae bacterium]